jgi:hypothetical protein
MNHRCKTERRSLGELVHIIYLDDSKQDKSKDRFQVIGAVILHDENFDYLEQSLGYYLYELVEPHVTGKFEEFHAADLLAGNPPFDNVKRDQALEIFGTAIATMVGMQIPVVYGAVDLNRLYATNYATAKPVDMAFRICIKLIEQWFQEEAHDSLGLLIADDSEKSVRNEMSNAFHLFRRIVRSSPPDRGELWHLHDDMYFGDSKYSKGIQLADLCTLLIGRHLAGFSDTEDLYLELSKNIFKGAVEPQ